MKYWLDIKKCGQYLIEFQLKYCDFRKKKQSYKNSKLKKRVWVKWYKV